MASPGNDPFSGSTVRNFLQHIFSPKIVAGDGNASNLVKTDIINVDNVYVGGDVLRSGAPINVTMNPVNVGTRSTQVNNGTNTIAIGFVAGSASQGNSGIAIGSTAGQLGQGSNAIAIGTNAGNYNQGANSIAIGTAAGITSQAAGTIVINASGSTLNSAGTSTCVIKPIRGDFNANLTANGFKNVYYNPQTGELCYTTN
jgi:hypothetical protein